MMKDNLERQCLPESHNSILIWEFIVAERAFISFFIHLSRDKGKDILEFYVDDNIEGFENKFQLKMLPHFLNKGTKMIFIIR